MSRSDFNNKVEADYLWKIDIYWLKKHGYLNDLKSGTIALEESWKKRGGRVDITAVTFLNDYQNYIRLQYVYKDYEGNEQNIDYKIRLTSTPCNYGGKRFWFDCPICGRNVGVLYKKGYYFWCRHCHNLTYESKNCGYSVISMSELESMRRDIKIRYYKGKMTRKYKRFLREESKIYAILSRYS